MMAIPNPVVFFCFPMLAVFCALGPAPSAAALFDHGQTLPAESAQGPVMAASGGKPRPKGGLRQTGLPLPRYASLRSAKVNLRAGPGIRYPVEWVYMRRGLPLMIVAEFDAWRKVRDWRGTVGWVHRSMLTGKRTVIATASEVVLRRKPSPNAPAVARARAGVIARVVTCQGNWCRIEAGGIRGLGPRSGFWGTLPKENIN